MPISPLQFWLKDHVCTIERNTPGKDTSGGQLDNFQPISAMLTGIPCCIGENKKHAGVVDMSFDRRDLKGNFFIMIGFDPSIRPLDRINVTKGRLPGYYEVHGGFDFGHPALTSQVVYLIDCTLRRK